MAGTVNFIATRKFLGSSALKFLIYLGEIATLVFLTMLLSLIFPV